MIIQFTMNSYECMYYKKKIKVEFFTINGLYFYTCNIMNWKYDNKCFLLSPLIVTLVGIIRKNCECFNLNRGAVVAVIIC
jgi:hypothetical protein